MGAQRIAARPGVRGREGRYLVAACAALFALALTSGLARLMEGDAAPQGGATPTAMPRWSHCWIPERLGTIWIV